MRTDKEENDEIEYFYLGPSHNAVCGAPAVDWKKQTVSFMSNMPVNYTWAYALCPLENECETGHHNCTKFEDCIDRPDGFLCSCKDGYQRNHR